MIFKTLKHRTIPDTFGHIYNKQEIYHCEIPDLLPMTATIDTLKDLNKGNSLILEQVEDYDMVVLEVNEKIIPVKSADGLTVHL